VFYKSFFVLRVERFDEAYEDAVVEAEQRVPHVQTLIQNVQYRSEN
jgi:hypothetical protein